MKSTRLAYVLCALMCGASIAGFAARPSAKAVDKGNVVSLEAMVPQQFGDWKLEPDQGLQVVNPQTKEILDKLYSQVLTRTYVNQEGYRIMLSMAYGDDQRGGLQAHRPEVCYPAQGFQLGRIEDGALPTRFGNIEVRRLTTNLGPRNEPVTYWLTVGNQVIKSTLEKRIAQIRLGLTGQIPDGLLFRISSIDRDDARGFSMQQKFTADLMSAVSPATRKQLSGLTPAPSPAS
jgi:EpsI family protein